MEKYVNPKKKRFNTECRYEKLNDLIFHWFSQARSKNIPVSGVLIQEKAAEFAKELELADFKASNGWLNRWKERNSVKGFKICGESAGVNLQTVTEFKGRVKEVIQGYEDKDIFNCDETGLFYRALSDKTLAVKGQSTSGSKMPKDRVTVLFACSASGEKLQPLVIGKAQNPRCFKSVNKSQLGVDYVANTKAWMTNAVFMEWLKSVNKTMRLQGRNILLFLDNAGSHGHEIKLSNVTLKFLPPNTTSHLQPLDQGIIRTFKSLYRKNMTRSLLSAIESSQDVQELCKKVTLLDAIRWISRAWKDVKCTTIQKCFRNVGLSVNATDVEEEEFDDDDIPLSELARQLALDADDLEHIDDNVPTEDDSEEWEKSLVESYRTTQEDNEVPEEEEAPEAAPGSELSLSGVLTLVNQLRNFAISQDCDYLELAEVLQLMTEKKLVKQKCSLKQSTLKAFFNSE